MKIDVIVPFHSKDGDTFNWCVQGIRKLSDTRRILAVCDQTCQSLVESAGAVFFDENKCVEGLTSRSFDSWRWGWYFQQILKLGMADWVETDYYLVVDSDTVFLRNVPLFNPNGKPLYATGTEYHKPYFDVFERLLGFNANREYSFTVHHMVYNKHIVREMRGRFPDKPWYANIVKYVEPQAPWFSESQFNEQDTYGHYIKALYPDQVNLRPLKWVNVSSKPSRALFHRLAKHFDYCSLHSYLRSNVSLSIRARNRVKSEMEILKAQLGKA